MSSEQPTQAPGQGQETSQPPRSQKSMTKAERRELQEKQRAAKAATKASGSTGQTNKSAAKQPEGGGDKSSGKQNVKQGSGSGPSTQTHTHQRRASRVSVVGGEITWSGGGPGGNIASDLASRSMNPRGVRIFSHFGLQQRFGAGKGLIHPAIVRLGLLFSDFQITGANARCLAALTAFKHVRSFQFLTSAGTEYVSGYPRLYHAPEQHPVASSNDALVGPDQPPRRRAADGRDYGQRHSAAQVGDQWGGYRFTRTRCERFKNRCIIP